MTEKEKMEKGFLYMPSGDLVKHRYNIQDAVFEYNKIPPSHYAERATAIKKFSGKPERRLIYYHLSNVITVIISRLERIFLQTITSLFLMVIWLRSETMF